MWLSDLMGEAIGFGCLEEIPENSTCNDRAGMGMRRTEHCSPQELEGKGRDTFSLEPGTSLSRLSQMSDSQTCMTTH